MSESLSVGIVLAVLGMGGTVLTLGLLAGLTVLLKRAFPYEPEREK